jgi:hypothetical protein
MFGRGGSVQPGAYVVEIAHGQTVVRRPFSITGEATASPRSGGESAPEHVR